MKIFAIRVAVIILATTLGSFRIAVSQVSADLGAGGLNPQVADFSPSLSFSNSPEGLQQGGGRNRPKNHTYGIPKSSIPNGPKGALYGAQLGNIGYPPPLPSMALNLAASASISPAAHVSPYHPAVRHSFSLSSSNADPFGIVIGGNSGTHSVARPPRRFPVQKSASEPPLYSFLIRHETVSKVPNSKPGSSKGIHSKKSRGALIDSLTGARNPR
jgi:hypothetical protein